MLEFLSAMHSITAPARKQELNLSHVTSLHSVSSLSQAYISLLPMNQQGICSALLTFLESQHTMTGNMTLNLKCVFSIPVHSSKPQGKASDALLFSCAAGSACALGQETSLDWLQKNLGAFASNAHYEDFTRLMTDFSGVSFLTQAWQLCSCSGPASCFATAPCMHKAEHTPRWPNSVNGHWSSHSRALLPNMGNPANSMA